MQTFWVLSTLQSRLLSSGLSDGLSSSLLHSLANALAAWYETPILPNLAARAPQTPCACQPFPILAAQARTRKELKRHPGSLGKKGAAIKHCKKVKSQRDKNKPVGSHPECHRRESTLGRELKIETRLQWAAEGMSIEE